MDINRDYKTQVDEEASSFISDHEDMIIEAVKDSASWDYNDIHGLDTSWHECITDRCYSSMEAAFVIDNCENEETDTGLWEGLDLRQQLSAMAAYSYANDVWFACKDFYEQIKEDVEEALDDLRDELQEEMEAELAGSADDDMVELDEDIDEDELEEKVEAQKDEIIKNCIAGVLS